MSTVAESQPQRKMAGLITPDELYRRLGVIGKSSIYDALRANRIKHLRIGRKILVLESEVEDWPRREAETQK